MKRNGHDEIGLIDERAARLQHPSRQCFEPVAAAGPLEIEHRAPGGGIIDHGGAGTGQRGGRAMQGAQVATGGQVEAERTAERVADGTREEVDLAEFLRHERALADTALAGNQ